MRLFVSFFSALLLLSCGGSSPRPGGNVQFSDTPTTALIQPGQIDEASGMVDSRSQPGNLWVQQDGGSPAELALLGHDGRLKGKIAIPNASNRDWEDMTSGPGPREGVNYLYIGEIGDNNAQYASVNIYRLPEPAGLGAAVGPVERINFRYPDGPRDAEALICDPQTRDLFIISKREAQVRLYRLPYPQTVGEVMTAQALGTLPLSFVTGAGISPDGTEILLQTYGEVRYWKRQAGQSVADALQRAAGRVVPFRAGPQAPQTEAICFDRDGRGYFTLSERFNAPQVALFYYAKK